MSRVVPWFDWSEWHYVMKSFYLSSNFLNNVNQELTFETFELNITEENAILSSLELVNGMIY